MTHDEAREALEAEIAAQVKARRKTSDPDEKAAAKEAIELLEDEVDRLDVLAANELGAKVDEIIENLKKVLDEKSLDAASALGRTIKRLEDFVDDPGTGG